MKMKNTSKIICVVASLLILSGMLAGISLAAKSVTIVGYVNDQYQIVDDEGTVYEIADSEKGEEVAELIDRKLRVTGSLMDADGTPIIEIIMYEVIDD
jgi:hypothetical protein